MNEPNAICMRSLVGDVITVSETLRSFYYFVVICVLGPDRGVPLMDTLIAGWIALRIMNGAEAPDFDLDPRCKPPPRLEAELRSKVDAMLEFTFGHEFAHCLLGHLDRPSASTSDVRRYGFEDEFAADRYAVSSVADRVGRRRMADAAYMVMMALQLVQEVSQQRREVPRLSVSDTHPSPLDRIWALHEALGSADAGRREFLRTDLATVANISETLISVLQHQQSDLLTLLWLAISAGLGWPAASRPH